MIKLIYYVSISMYYLSFTKRKKNDNKNIVKTIVVIKFFFQNKTDNYWSILKQNFCRNNESMSDKIYNNIIAIENIDDLFS